MKWNDITLRQWNNLQDVLSKTDPNDEDRDVLIMTSLFGDSVLDLPISEYHKKLNELTFLNEEMPTNRVPKKYSINGKTYIIQTDMSKMPTAQYIDYRNLLKTGEINKWLSVFFIPEGHKYGDGYDLNDVFEDLLEVDIATINSLAFFFKRQYQIFTKIFQFYSI